MQRIHLTQTSCLDLGCMCIQSLHSTIIKGTTALISKYCFYPSDSPAASTTMPAIGQAVEKHQATQKNKQEHL